MATDAKTSAQVVTTTNAWTPIRVEVFATSSMRIQNDQQATIHRIDGQEQLVAALNQDGLPPDQRRALAIVRQRAEAMGPALRQRALAPLHAVQAAVVYGVRQVPAVVFDGARVVYGTTDVAHALAILRSGGAESIGQRFMPGTAGIPKPSRSATP